MKKTIISIFILIIALIPPAVQAQQVSLSINPSILELIIKPGKSIMVAYQIKNAGDPNILTTKLVNFEPRDNLGGITLKNNLSGPIRFGLDNADLELERPFFLKTGSSQQLLLRIRAPEGAPSGDYYYTLLVETTPQNNIEGVANTQAKASIGSNILITVTESGIVEVKPKVVLFQFLDRFSIFNKKINIFDSFSKIPLVFIIENKGKNLIKPEGKITLKGNFGEKIEYQIVPKNILAESQRLIEATPSAQIVYKNKPISLLLSGFFIGLYRLSTQVTFGENSPTIYAYANFFVFPFKLIIILLIVIVITINIIKNRQRDEDED